MKNRILLMLICVMIMLFGSSCGMSGCRINFDELKYPVSMSGSLYDPTGGLVETGKELLPIQNFEHTKYLCSILYSIIPLSGTGDIIELMNKKIEAARGDGMTNVSVSSDYSTLTSVVPLNLLPVWPGCSEVTVKGTIVRLERH